MKLHTAFSILSILVLGGCTNSNIVALGADTFLVTVSSALSTPEIVQQEAVEEGAECCLSNGYKSFVITSYQDGQQAVFIGQATYTTQGSITPSTTGANYQATTTYTPPPSLVKNHLRIQIHCFRTLEANALNAEKIIAAKKARVAATKQRYQDTHPFSK